MREQEHAWEPYRPGDGDEGRGAGSAADGTDRRLELRSLEQHAFDAARAAPARCLPARHLADAVRAGAAEAQHQRRTATATATPIPLYTFPNKRVLWHFLPDMPLRVSALRALGAYANVFAIESFMDELALAAEADPVEFRLRHLEDPRARDVVDACGGALRLVGRAAAGRAAGRGFAFARYKNLAAYLALALEVEVERETGRVRVVRAVAAIDSGEVVNPDGIRNQTEGGILQSISWTLYEAVTFDDTRITSIDWSSYPILRFGSVPDSVEVHIIDRPGEPFLGTGEAAQGPAAAAVGNAIRDAIGKRLYDLPLTRERVKAAIGV